MSQVNSQYNFPPFEQYRKTDNTGEFKCRKTDEYKTDEFRCHRTDEHNTDQFSTTW